MSPVRTGKSLSAHIQNIPAWTSLWWLTKPHQPTALSTQIRVVDIKKATMSSRIIIMMWMWILQHGHYHMFTRVHKRPQMIQSTHYSCSMFMFIVMY